MLEHTKMRPIEKVVVIRNGKSSPAYWMPSGQIDALLNLLSNYGEAEEETTPWRNVFSGKIDRLTEPGLMLRGARGKAGLTQVQVAKRLGVPQSHISEMEHGKRSIGKKMAQRLSKVLDVGYRVFL